MAQLLNISISQVFFAGTGVNIIQINGVGSNFSSNLCFAQIQHCCCSVSKSVSGCNPTDCSIARPLCPSTAPGVCPSSYPLNQWCHPTISSSVALFSFCLQSFPASGSFPMSRLFASGGQSIGASAFLFQKRKPPVCIELDFLLSGH